MPSGLNCGDPIHYDYYEYPRSTTSSKQLIQCKPICRLSLMKTFIYYPCAVDVFILTCYSNYCIPNFWQGIKPPGPFVSLKKIFTPPFVCVDYRQLPPLLLLLQLQVVIRRLMMTGGKTSFSFDCFPLPSCADRK